MATPIAHALTGLSLYLVFTKRPLQKREWKWLLLAAFLASAADFDFIPGALFGDLNAFHRGVSHSIGGCFFIALLLWGGLRSKSPFSSVRLFLFLFVVYGSHLVIDFFTRDTWPPCGAPFLWPFWSAYFKSPVDLFLDANRTPLTLIFSLKNIRTYLFELVVFGPPLFFLAKSYSKNYNQKQMETFS